MKKLDLLVIKAFIGPFIITFLVLTFIFVTTQIIAYLDELTGKGIGFANFAQLTFLLSFNSIPRSLPLAIMVSSLMTYGNLGQHSELTAIKSSGISLLKILKPTLIFVCFICFVSYYFNAYWLPKINIKAYSLLYDLRHKKPALDFKPGMFYGGIPDYSIRIEDKDEESQSLYGVMIYDHSKMRGNVDVISADSGRMTSVNGGDNLVIELYHGTKSALPTEDNHAQSQEYSRTSFDKTKMVFDLSSFSMKNTDEGLFRNNRQVMTAPQLKVYSDSVYAAELAEREILKEGLRSKFRYMAVDTMPHDTFYTTYSELALPDKELHIVNKAMTQARSMKRYLEEKEAIMFEMRKRAIRYEVEWWHDYSQSMACLIMFVLGAPVGAILKKGGLGIPALVTVVFYILYYVIMISCEKLARVEEMGVFTAIWMPTYVLMPVGGFFILQAYRDASMFEFDGFKRFFSIKRKNTANNIVKE